MKILFDNVENQEGTIYVSLDDGAGYNQYELKNVWSTGSEIPDDTDFSKVKIKARAEIFKNLFVVSGMKTLATYKIDFDIEKEMISYYKKTEVDNKLSSLSTNINSSISDINEKLNKSVLNVTQDDPGYVKVLYNNSQSEKVVVGSPTDDKLDSTSTNPVQNKVVNAALSGKVDIKSISSDTSITKDSYNAVLIIATSAVKLTYPNTSGTSISQALTAGSMTILAKSGSGYTNSIFGAVYN